MTRAQTLIPGLVLLAIAGWVAACGDGATEPPSPDSPRATTLTVTPATAGLTALGETVRLSAEVRDHNGQAMAGATVTWSSGDPSVATVDATGLVTAVSNGTATIAATSGSVSGTAAVTVTQAVSAVTVSPAVDTLVARGDTVRLAAAATDANGHAVAESEFSWASGDTAVATVDPAGLVTGVAAGAVEIAATSSGVTGRAVLAVVDPAPAAVAVTPDTVVLSALGQTAQLAAEARDQIGRVMEGGLVFWSSADTTVAVVDTAGLVTAIGGGATMIAATAGDVSGTAVVTVMQSAGSVVVSPASDTVAPGDTLRLAAEAFDESGHRVEGAEFTWSSSNVDVARVDGSGLVAGAAEGTATITATAGSASGTSEITVENLDRAALVALYHATDGRNWMDNTNWLTDAPLGDWHGVDTDGEGRVVRLNLGPHWDDEAQRYVSNGLSGSIPPQLGDLASLTELRLSLNNLGGPIPAELGKLTGLTTLNINSNHLSGPIPRELGGLRQLERLEMGWNELSGSIPRELGDLVNLRRLELIRNSLSGPIPVEIGKLTRLEDLRLGENRLSGPIPSTFGNLARLRTLWLSYNDLSGPIPPELGNLTGLTRLLVEGNRLSGAVPRTLLNLSALREFHFGSLREGADLCAPGTTGFVAWLLSLEEYSGAFCNEADMAVLESLYEAAGGPGWTVADGWLASPATGEWHGVRADSLGRVEALDLTGNGLDGRLPQNLGHLAGMTELRVEDNALSGRLPKSLMELSLRELQYAGTQLCIPSDGPFREWLLTIPSHQGTGVECAEPSEREILEILYDVTDGPNWSNRAGWLSATPPGAWHGVNVDAEGSVTELSLARNNLTGPIPPELSGLDKLRFVDLQHNALSGSIAPELGDLTDLERLHLGENELAGPIPPELGDLADLWWLDLRENELTGPLPPELGDLAHLLVLDLRENELTGPLPPELGDLVELERLHLGENELAGNIPPELGDLADLRWLDLGENELTGNIPPELGGLGGLTGLHLGGNGLAGALPPQLGNLTNLVELILGNNLELGGVLPAELTALSELDALTAGGTGLCAPRDDIFREWLSGIRRLQVVFCESGGASNVYLTQAVQSPEADVPLLAGRPALLRVFVTAPQSTGTTIPPVRARFYLDGSEAHVANIAAKSIPIPTEMREGELDVSSNALIPRQIVRPGLEAVIEIDPDGTLDPALGVTGRIPETGRMAVDVRTMPTLDLTLIPFLWSTAPDSAVVHRIRDMAADPWKHEMLRHARTLLPVGDMDVTAHAPVVTSTNDAYRLLDETEMIRVMEGGAGHYMGMMSGRIRGAAGLAHRYGRSAFSTANLVGTLAHELGHNMSLWHAPCGNAGGVDPAFPQPDGSIGAWGYDFRGRQLVAPDRPDLMGYCISSSWISGYHFTNALRFRLSDEGASSAAAAAAPATSLVLWGGADAEGVPYLEPAFAVDAPPSLPRGGNEYTITGFGRGGEVLFSFGFDMPETADGDGRSSFAFALPTLFGWEALARITLTGPGGSAILDADSDIPMAILRDAQTGQIRGILRDPPPAAHAAADAVGQGAATRIEVLFSRGIPGAEAWRR